MCPVNIREYLTIFPAPFSSIGLLGESLLCCGFLPSLLPPPPSILVDSPCAIFTWLPTSSLPPVFRWLLVVPLPFGLWFVFFVALLCSNVWIGPPWIFFSFCFSFLWIWVPSPLAAPPPQKLGRRGLKKLCCFGSSCSSGLSLGLGCGVF